MADYSFGSAMGDDGPESDSLGSLLTYGAESDEETPGQPGGAPNVKSDASAPLAPTAHVTAVSQPASAPSQASQAPTFNGGEPDELQALQAQKVNDLAPQTVAPKWWERLAGGLSAGAMAFGHVPGALEAGQSVTNRGQIAADNAQAGKVAQDDAAIQAWQDGQKQRQVDFQNQNEAYRTKQEGVRNDQEAADSKTRQADSDRNFTRQSANDQFNQTRDTAKDAWEESHQTTTANETARHNKAEESISSQNTAISRARLERDTLGGGKGDPSAKPLPAGTAARISDSKNKDMQDAQRAYNEAIKSAKNPQDAADLKQTYIKSMQDAQNKFEQAIEATGRSTNHMSIGDDLKWKAAQSDDSSAQTATKDDTSAPAQGTIAKPPKPNTPLTDKTIAQKYLAAAGGDKVKARAAAQKDGWQF